MSSITAQKNDLERLQINLIAKQTAALQSKREDFAKVAMMGYASAGIKDQVWIVEASVEMADMLVAALAQKPKALPPRLIEGFNKA